MNAKKAKKIRQYTRREVKLNIGEGMSILSAIVRPRPRWILAYSPLFPKKYRHMIYKYLN